MINRKLVATVLAVGMVGSICSPACAATGYQGCAVYRNGVAVVEWHAGIMDDPYINPLCPIIHIDGGSTVDYCNLEEFLEGNDFKGVYIPKSGLTSAQRDAVLATANELRREDIGYTFLQQVKPVKNYNGFVEPSEIAEIRCDGVVEYSYEFNGIKVYDPGYDLSSWNVCTGAGVASHVDIHITPKIQATVYMTKVRSTVPYK